MSAGLDPRYTRLLAAARAWRGSIIPGTSTAPLNVTRVLQEAIDAFDPEARAANDCEHPRKWHVFYPGGIVECGYCGTVVAESVAQVKPLAIPPVEP